METNRISGEAQIVSNTERDEVYIQDCKELGINLEDFGEKFSGLEALTDTDFISSLIQLTNVFSYVSSRAVLGGLHDNPENERAYFDAVEGNADKKLGYDLFWALSRYRESKIREIETEASQ